MAATTLTGSAEAHQRPSLPRTQANAWLRLLLAMSMPALWLLLGISLTR